MTSAVYSMGQPLTFNLKPTTFIMKLITFEMKANRMNLYFRLLLILLKSRFRSPTSIMDSVTSTFRVWPTDLDVLGHMTNSRYLSIMDVARTDLLLRAGAISKLKTKSWYPVVVDQSIQFRRSLMPFREFQVKTEVTGYDDKHIILRQTFLVKKNVAAIAVVRTRFLGPGMQKVSPTEVLALSDDIATMGPGIHHTEQATHLYLKELIAEQVSDRPA